jgi:hypothetical protein
MKFTSRSEALARGLKRYYTGEPCKYGHIAERWAFAGECVICHRLAMLEWSRKQPEGACVARTKASRKANPDKRKAQRDRWRARRCQQ